MSIYKNIKKIANRKNIQQKDLAVAFGVTENTMTNYLTGRTKIVADQVPLFAKFLKVSIEELFTENDDVKNPEPWDGNEPQAEGYSCPDCRPRIKRIKELEETVLEIREKLTNTHEKYIKCLEEIAAKKENPSARSA